MDPNEQPLKEQLEKAQRDNRKAHEQLFQTEEQKAQIAEERDKIEKDLKKKELVTDVLMKQLDEARKETEEERKGREEEKESKKFYRGQAHHYEAERDAAEERTDVKKQLREAAQKALKASLQKRGSSIATKADCLPHQQVVNPCQDQMIAIPLGLTEEADTEPSQICTPSGIKNLPEKSAPSLTPCALEKLNTGQMMDNPLGQLEDSGSHKDKIYISSRMPNVDAIFAIADDCESNEHTSRPNLPPVAAGKV